MAATIDVGKVLTGAFLIPWWRRREFAKALAIPAALLICVSLIAYTPIFSKYPIPLALALIAVALPATIWFAVQCHRLVLLDPSTVAAEGWLHRWTRRETRFLCIFIFMWIFVLIVFGLFLPAVRNVDGVLAQLLRYVALLPGYALLGRLALALPATAVDRDVGFRWSWQLSKGKTIKLLLVVGVFPECLGAFGYLLRDVPSFFETALFALLGTVVLAIEITALSLAYRELAGLEVDLQSA